MDTEDKAEKSLLNRIIATMSAVFMPFVYILSAAGLIQGCLIIITYFVPAFRNSGTYQVLDFISWTPFTFLPVLIALTASKRFGCSTMISLWCCLALVNNSWTEIASRIADGEVIRFLGIPMTQTTYTSTVLPPLLVVFLLSRLEKWLKSHLPEMLQEITVPLICVVLMVPFTILLVGPISEICSNEVATGYNFLVNHVPVVAGALVGGVWQFIVILGMHWGVTPLCLQNYALYGCDSFQAFQTCAVIGQVAACFGVMIRTRNSRMKKISFSAGLTGIFGITEPAIYGVTLRLKRPMAAGCIAGATGGVIVALFGSRDYVYATLPGILTTVNSISSTNRASFPGMIVAEIVTVVMAVILTYAFGFDDPINEKSSVKSEADSAFRELSINVTSPFNGQMTELTDVSDSTFSDEKLGTGVAVIPSDGNVYAPFDSRVTNLFETKQAICLTDKNGADVLIHVGIGTEKLNGKYFHPVVKNGDDVKKGDLLMTFDIESISTEYDITSPVLVTNAGDLGAQVTIEAPSGRIAAGDAMIRL